MKKSISKILAAFVAMTVTFSISDSQAQGTYYYPEATTSIHQSGYCSDGNLGQSILTLDQYGDQMSYLYAMEVRNYCGCSNATALLSEMRRYNTCTNNLIAAYQGTCPRSFQNAACNVQDSLMRVQTLRNRARVSPQVCALITHSCPLSSYIHCNRGSFHPVIVPQSPIYHPYPQHSACSPTAPILIERSHQSYNNRPGIDVRSAIFGAVAGRVIHGIIHRH